MTNRSTLGDAGRALSLVCVVAYLLSCVISSADPVDISTNTIFARGINLSSAEFTEGRTPGIYGKDYIYPPSEELDYYASKGFSVVRLPYRWERLQHSLFGPLESSELGHIKDFLAAARARNMRVILSPHNFGRYRIGGKETLIGTARVPTAAFADFSNKVAAAFVGDDSIYALSLMNEPHDSDGMWKQVAQAGLDAIRKADRQRLVLVPGDQWSEASKWRRFNDDFLLNDPSSRIKYEAHQYFDADHTGTYKLGYALSGATSDLGVERIRPFVEWLKQHDQKGIITEFGVPNGDARWLQLVQGLLAYLAKAKIPWTYWAGGPWWGSYPLSAEPRDGIDAPVMTVLTKDYGMQP